MIAIISIIFLFTRCRYNVDNTDIYMSVHLFLWIIQSHVISSDSGCIHVEDDCTKENPKPIICQRWILATLNKKVIRLYQQVLYRFIIDTAKVQSTLLRGWFHVRFNKRPIAIRENTELIRLQNMLLSEDVILQTA